MTICLFEDGLAGRFAPLTSTRAVADLRLGPLTLLERWQHVWPDAGVALHVRDALAEVVRHEHPGVSVNEPTSGPTLYLNARLVCTRGPALERLKHCAAGNEPARTFTAGDHVAAAWRPAGGDLNQDAPTEDLGAPYMLARVWDVLDAIGPRIVEDAASFPLGEHTGAHVSPHAILEAPEQIYLAPGSRVHAGAILNASAGPVLIGENATVMEGAILRGPVSIGAHAQVKMAARVDQSVIGPWCKAGGEIHASVLHSFSNKGHDGYLGNSYLGRWCNLGADTNTSNLRNDYGIVDLYDMSEGRYTTTGRQFIGLIMGDHSKAGINTMFNTGTVIGVFCNLFGGGYMPRYAPHFSWGGPEGFRPYLLRKAFQVARAVMKRRGLEFSEAESALLSALSTET